ncbi:MAG: hypothetical protein Q8J66_11895 [Methylotenera sp.]|nr:hypothetical protein [Methylotenera sp.]
MAWFYGDYLVPFNTELYTMFCQFTHGILRAIYISIDAFERNT